MEAASRSVQRKDCCDNSPSGSRTSNQRIGTAGEPARYQTGGACGDLNRTISQGNRDKKYVTKRQSVESMTILDSVDGDGHGLRGDGRGGIRRNGCLLESFHGLGEPVGNFVCES